MVVVGLMIGNGGRQLAMSDTTRRHIDLFWELIDEILNAVLFVLIGMEVLLISFSLNIFVAAAVAMAITLVARAITVGLPVVLLPGAFKLPKGSGWVLTWGGLRGGISVALPGRCRLGTRAMSCSREPIASWCSPSSFRASRSENWSAG
jgi:monovalent cation:H+ antiporter, CPA1 family